MVEVEGLGEVDVYPVGILRSMIDSRNELRAWSRHAVAVGPVHGYLRLTLRLMRSQVQQRKWHDLKNNFNGYLAEPRTWPEGGTLRRCGSGWTRGRALRDLERRYRRSIRDLPPPE